ncbi:MAG: acyl-CoA/acyl-ACP dehydrogenase, partial [Deltaproteobacteria bacterium]|nr:acyl-CoA/acyl-ACP dehydrogenase [Deltaproteobacteria bacterium]
MDYKFTEDQEMIREAAKDFLEQECPKEKVRHLRDDEKAYDPEMWKKMIELGWMGVVLPEEYGGIGGEFLDLLVILEEMGRNILPSPFFQTVVLCSMPILKFGSDDQKNEYLTKIATEGQIWTLAINETDADYLASDVKLAASATGDEYTLNGKKLFVPYAKSAEMMLVIARTAEKSNPEEGVTAFIVDAKSPGISFEAMPVTARDARCEVTFKDVKVPKGNVLGSPDKGWDIVEYILTYAPVLKAAEMAGGVQSVLNITTKYASERIQFGKPIGSYQAVQHRLVDLLTQAEGLRYLTYEAASAINAGNPSKLLTSLAKLKANNVYQ